MEHREFFNRLKDVSTLPRVCLFTGEEEYVKDSALARLKSALLPEGLEALNLQQFDEREGGEKTTLRDLQYACDAPPLMAERRLTLMYNSPLLQAAKSQRAEEGGGEDGEKASARKAELEWLDTLPDFCFLLFFQRGKADSRKPLYKAIAKAGAVVEFKPLSRGELSAWLEREARRCGKTLRPGVTGWIAERGGGLLTELSGQFAQILAYVGERSEIRLEDAQRFIAPEAEDRSYKLVEALLDGKAGEAAQMLERMLQEGEAAPKILAGMAAQYRRMLQLLALEQSPLSPRERLAESGQKEFAYKSSLSRAQRLGQARLIALLEDCNNADMAFKRGRMKETLAVEWALLRGSEIVAGRTKP